MDIFLEINIEKKHSQQKKENENVASGGLPRYFSRTNSIIDIVIHVNFLHHR